MLLISLMAFSLQAISVFFLFLSKFSWHRKARRIHLFALFSSSRSAAALISVSISGVMLISFVMYFCFSFDKAISP